VNVNVAAYISDLERDFCAFRAVSKLTLHVKRGEIYGLLGPTELERQRLSKSSCLPCLGNDFAAQERIRRQIGSNIHIC
jgi:hypothetical protein